MTHVHVELHKGYEINIKWENNKLAIIIESYKI